jgi:hypothetical protein
MARQHNLICTRGFGKDEVKVNGDIIRTYPNLICTRGYMWTRAIREFFRYCGAIVREVNLTSRIWRRRIDG